MGGGPCRPVRKSEETDARGIFDRLAWPGIARRTAAGPRRGVGSRANQTENARIRRRTPASIIYIGNSFFYYNNGITAMYAAAEGGRSRGRPLRSTIGTSAARASTGTTSVVLPPERVGTYPSTRRTTSSSTSSTAVRRRRHDGLQPVPGAPAAAGRFTEYAKKHTETVRQHGAKPVFFMSWAYRQAGDDCASAEAYTKAGNDNDAFVIPAGLAFAPAPPAARSHPLCPTSATRPRRHLPCRGTVYARCSRGPRSI